MEKGTPGKPKYHMYDMVSFDFIDDYGNEEKKIGSVYIVDSYGTFFNTTEPSYDIMVYENANQCLYKHIPESFVSSIE